MTTDITDRKAQLEIEGRTWGKQLKVFRLVKAMKEKETAIVH